MHHISSSIQNTIPISLFNKGLAGRIFEEVKKVGVKVVMKNNSAECVLMSPEEYIRLIDEINDARLLAVATERMEHFNPSETIYSDDVYKSFGITKEMIDSNGEVEIE